jgi:hypothetical protein
LALGNSSVANDNNSIAIGTSANSSASNQSIAIGSSATASGFQSIALGLSSNASTNSAIAIGNNSKASAQQGTALGAESNAAGQNATAIGYQATATQSNSIILGSSSNGSNRIGIGTNTPDERLHIAGSVKIVDGSQSNNYVLTSDANGKASWKDPNANKAYAEIFRSSNTALTSSAIPLDSFGLNSGMTLSSSNIQVQNTGIYRITYTVSIQKNSGSAIQPSFYLTIYGTEIAGTRTFASVVNGDTKTVSLTKLVSLNAFQAVSVYSSLSDSNTLLLANGCNLIVEFIK